MKNKLISGGKLKATIRAFTGVWCVIAIILFWNNRHPFISIDNVFPEMDNFLRSYALTDFVRKAIYSFDRGLVILLITALAAFMLAGINDKKEEDLGYRLNIIAIVLALLTLLVYVFEYIVILDGEFTGGLKGIIFFASLFIFEILALGYEMICYKKEKEQLKHDNKSAAVKSYIVICAGVVIAVLFSTVSFSNIYINIREYKELQKIQGQELRESVAYQIGNYSFRNGMYADGRIILLDSTGDGTKRVRIIDEAGNYKTIYNYLEGESTNDMCGYYNGYFYIYTGTDRAADVKGQIVRINIQDGSSEVVYEDTGSGVDFSIVDDKMYYYFYTADSRDTVDIYYIDLDEEFNLNRGILYDTEIVLWRMDDDLWLNRFLYNQRDIGYLGKGTDLYYIRQSYGDYSYDFRYDTAFNYDNSYWLARTQISGDGSDTETFAKEVQQFNIFDEKIYYVKRAEESFELWSCNMDGTEQKLISAINATTSVNYQNDDGTQYTEDRICSNIIVGEGYAVCDFGTDNFTVEQRYIVNIREGTVRKVEY